MSVLWACTVLVCAILCAGADHGRGGSLRGALEALQRRQRGRFHAPQALPDYEALYEYIPSRTYPETDYVADIEEPQEDPAPKYIVKFLESQRHPPENYEYKIIKKKNIRNDQEKTAANRKESAFRERTQHSDNDRLRAFFGDRNEAEQENQYQERAENDAEYALLLSQLWSKYKNNHKSNADPSQGVIKLYKDNKIVKKRAPGNWGPIAYKKKRSTNIEDEPLDEYTAFLRSRAQYENDDTNIDDADGLPDSDKNNLQEEYTVAFQPLDDEPPNDLSDEERYSYDVLQKRFPVAKRSSGPYALTNNQIKRYAQDVNSKYKSSRTFRSSSGTDPKIIKDLSKIFGESEDQIIKTPVKRSSDNKQEGEEKSHETKPPQVTVVSHSTQDHNNTHAHNDESHEQLGHSIHHPGIAGKEIEHVHPMNPEQEKPIIIKKKSIDWSQYFGIDKRKKKSVLNNLTQDRLRKQYFDTFNKEVIYPMNSFRKHSQVKRNYVENKPREDTEIQIDSARAVALQNSDNSKHPKNSGANFDDIYNKLKDMETMILDDEVDSKEEQEVKEKLLSRLAAAYSLEKMRKAMKEFKQSLKIQKQENVFTATPDIDDQKSKRASIKKEKAQVSEHGIVINSKSKGDRKQGDDFEGEQGAGHYLNGKTEEQFSEGYMGGSGQQRAPIVFIGPVDGTCPVLDKIVQRCRGVDLLVGDRGQLLLPLCSLHQICYLCAEAPPTTCDLMFLSEADTACEGDSFCQRSARSTLMALRELHDALADELDGECEASPCLPAALKLNVNWQRAIQR